MSSRNNHWVRMVLLGFCTMLVLRAQEVSVAGMGWWHGREMRQELLRLHADGPQAPGASVVEDMAFVLLADLEKRGFLKPTIQAVVTDNVGVEQSFVFDANLDTLLPRPLAVAKVRFSVKSGVRYELHEVHFTGLSVLPRAKAEAYFIPARVTPLGGAQDRVYSPAILRRSEGNLQAELLAMGYAESEVHASVVSINDETGQVVAEVDVREGPRWIVSRLVIQGSGAGVMPVKVADWTGRVWSVEWSRELAEWVRREHFRAGYADVHVTVTPHPAPNVQARRLVEAVVKVDAGPKISVGEIRFVGAEHTRNSVMGRRVRLRGGDPLDPVVLEQARQRLARLGVFKRVDLEVSPKEGTERDVIFAVNESPRVDARLLLGYGSYEQVRGGVELAHVNIWGLAHHSRMQLVQSFKSSQGDYTYSVPGLFGEAFDGSARLYGLRREEEAFTREELGVELAVRRRLNWGMDARVGYSYESLNNVANQLTTRLTDQGSVRVSSVSFGLSQDRRDHPLKPRAGWRWYSHLEVAQQELGGEVNYQRWELGVAWHQALGAGRWLHAGWTHGGIATLGYRGDAPVNRRFFPGGESSIRGYQSGEAAPRGADGRFVGADTFMLVNLELEQALTRNWSLVVFVDGLGEATRIRDYPFDEGLFSAGVGVRYNTLVGPLRLEYGHNLNPRSGDADGTLHFSVGFPF